jgi:general secretion pathway protein H
MPACAPVRSGGFTLLEVLVVVLLVGIISSIAMLGINAGGDERRLRSESDRLVTLLEQVSSEAVMQNQEYGLKLTDTGYLFLCLDEIKQRWLPCTAEKSLQEHILPEGVEVHVLRDSSLKLSLKSNDADEKEDDEEPGQGKKIYPDFLLLSSGEASPGSLEILLSDHPEIRSEIHIDDLGRISREGADADGDVRKGDDDAS